MRSRVCVVVLNCNNTWIGEEAPCLTYGMRGSVKLRLQVRGGGARSCRCCRFDPAPCACRLTARARTSTRAWKGACRTSLSRYGGARLYSRRILFRDTQSPLPQDLCVLLGSLVDGPSGRINVDGIYADVAPLSPSELQLYRGVDFDARAYMAARGLPGVYSQPSIPAAGSLRQAPLEAAAAAASDGPQRSGATADALSPSVSSGHKRSRPAEASGAPREGSGPVMSSSSGGGEDGSAATSLSVHDVSTAVLLRRWREPSVTVHGVSCSAANDSIIPHQAVSYISVRTVSGSAQILRDPDESHRTLARAPAGSQHVIHEDV